MVIYLSRLFFTKPTKAAGQDRLSKFEAVECSEIGRINPTSTVSTAPPWVKCENLDVLAKLMDYMGKAHKNYIIGKILCLRHIIGTTFITRMTLYVYIVEGIKTSQNIYTFI